MSLESENFFKSGSGPDPAPAEPAPDDTPRASPYEFETKYPSTPEQAPGTLPAAEKAKPARTLSAPPPMLDCHKNDPNIPGVVTIKPFIDGVVERIVNYPDGSFSSVYLGDWGDLAGDQEEDEPARAERVGADALACRLAEAQAGNWLFSHAAGAWFVWDGTIWRRDRRGLVAHTIREALREAGNDTGRLVTLVETCARSEPAFAAGVDDMSSGEMHREGVCFDAHPFRLGTPGGTLDLATGVLAPADREDRITRATAVTPAETADCPLWRRFLDEIMGGDRELIGFLQRYLGYALTGDTSEHALVYGLGEGGNGKSVFANVVRGILGDYAIVAAPDLFARGAETRAGKAHSAEIAMLAGARLVTASETEEGRTWADGRMKLLTGGDPLTARFVRSDFTTFTPRFKLLVIGNHMPALRIVDAAIRRRLCIVPFAHTPAEPDRRLEDKLKSEWPGILRWMIEGCLAWRAEGLGRPARVRAATADYLGSQDMVGQFLEERCDTGGDHTEPAGALFAAWCAFARAAGETPGTQRRFAVQLERHGLTRERTRHARIYRGLRLLSEDEREHWSGRDDLFRARAAIVACLAQRAARG